MNKNNHRYREENPMNFYGILGISFVIACICGAGWLIATGISTLNMLAYPLTILVFILSTAILARRFHV